MWKYVFLALLLMFPLIRGAVRAPHSSDPWAEAGLDKGYAAKFINNSLCSRDERWSRACYKGIKAGVSAAGIRYPKSISDFDGELETIDQKLSPEEKSKVYGQMVNEYLSAFDSHARIVPLNVLKQQLGAPAEDQKGVESSTFENLGHKYTVLKIRVFRSGVCEEVERALAAQAGQSAAVLLDLRDNGGGRNDEARCLYRLLSAKPLPVERRLLTHQLLPSELDLRPKQYRLKTGEDRLERPSQFANVRLAVLINGKSGSVTEMISAGLQDTQRAWLIGERSFGKGTFQLSQDLHFHSGLRLMHSVYEIVRPRGVAIQYSGVTPDFVVPMRTGPKPAREIDLFPPAEPITGKAWRETRVALRDRLQSCAQPLAPVEATADTQLAFAMGVLHCASKN